MKLLRILIISPHPDDETLGCGGTILKYKNLGSKIYWLIITNVDVKDGWDKEIVYNRQEEIKAVEKMYKFEQTFKLDFPTTKLNEISSNKLIKSISNAILKVKPEIIYMPNRSDVHLDHEVAFKAIYNCTKNFRYPFIKKMLMYETLSETEFSPALPENVFIPNVFVDITDYFNKKIEIMKIYVSEIMKSPLPRSLESIESLAKYRGSCIGRRYAEAFMLLKEII